MSWANTTLSTNETLQKWESEILSLTNDGEKQYFFQDADITGESNSIQISPFQEIIAVATSDLVLDSCQIKIKHSDDNSTFSDYGSLILYEKTGNITDDTELFRYVLPTDIKDYVKIEISGTNTGNISIYVKSRWADKITLAKDILGVDLELRLLQDGYTVDYDDGENILDLIANPTIFTNASDFMTLHLIYTDLAIGQNDEVFQKKAELYENRYKLELEKTTKLVDIDIDMDGTTDAYNQKLDLGSEFIR